MKKSTLRNKADKLFSRLIRSKGECEAKLPGCQGNKNLQTAHGISRSWGSLRYNELNAICCCASCHRKLDQNFILKWEVWKTLKGAKNVAWLRRQRPIPSILTPAYYERIIKELEEKLYGVQDLH